MAQVKGAKRRALRAAFPHTIPIMAAYGFVGMTYGMLMKTSGFGAGYALAISVLVFAGSMQFVTVGLLLSPFNPLQALAMTLMINARHLFYGVSMLDKYAGTGWKKGYMIFGLSDETFAVNYSAPIPNDVDRGWFMFFVTLLDQFYWVAGTVVGALLGSLIPTGVKGLDFAMTAMFVAIFVDQCRRRENYASALLGVGLSLICRMLFGAQDFLIPSMIAILASLLLLRKPLEKGGERA